MVRPFLGMEIQRERSVTEFNTNAKRRCRNLHTLFFKHLQKRASCGESTGTVQE